MSRGRSTTDILPIAEGTSVTPNMDLLKPIIYCLLLPAHSMYQSFDSFRTAGQISVRVELEALTQEDFRRILTQMENAIIKQQIALLKVENDLNLLRML